MHFPAARRLLDRVLAVSGPAIFVSYIIYVASPLVVIVRAYRSGRPEPALFVAPLRDLYYFFDATATPLFELCYAANAAKVGFVVMAYVTVDYFYVELCVYVLAMYAELRSMVGAVGGAAVADRPARLRQCIRFHVEIVG